MIFNTHRIMFASQREIKISRFQLKQAGQQFGIINIRAVSGIMVGTRTGMHSDPLQFFRSETGQRQIVQVYKAVEKLPGRVRLYRQSPFREVDLNLMSTSVKTAANLCLMFAGGSGYWTQPCAFCKCMAATLRPSAEAWIGAANLSCACLCLNTRSRLCQRGPDFGSSAARLPGAGGRRQS
jgi:hypothetical protein